MISLHGAPGDVDEALDREYALRRRHPEREEIYADYTLRSAMSRCSPMARLNIPYGPGVTSTLDLFLPEGVDRPPLLVFIHGGYWRALDKAIFSFIADTYVAHGVAVAIPNYALAPSVTVGTILDEVCEAVDWLRGAGAAAYAYDSDRIVLSGHSAGGHMASFACMRERWPGPAEALRGCVSISGVFDLRPLVHTTINHDLGLSAEDALALSVAPERIHAAPLLVAVGALETDGFRWQTDDFVQRCRSVGLAAEGMHVAGRNHFDVLNDFADPGHDLFQRTLALALAVAVGASPVR